MEKSHAMPAAAKTAETEKHADLKLVANDNKPQADTKAEADRDVFAEFDEMWDNLPV